jgi:hypothetical protein
MGKRCFHGGLDTILPFVFTLRPSPQIFRQGENANQPFPAKLEFFLLRAKTNLKNST